jgi:hypothetical protein
MFHSFVLQHLDFFFACDDFVGRADPLVGLFGRSKSSHLVAALCLVGQVENLRAGWQPALLGRA